MPSDGDTITRINDMSINLTSDKEIIARASRSSAVTPEQVKAYSRRALEVAYLCTLHEQTLNIGEFAQEFEELDHLARRVADALDTLIRFLAPDGHDFMSLERPITTTNAILLEQEAIALDGSQAASAFPGSQAVLGAILVRNEYDRARNDAQALWAARDAAKRLTEAAPRKAARLRRRQNDPKPDQREFVARLSEMWVFTTGKRPGSAPQASKNPFLRYASAAWQDVFPDGAADPAFVGGLRAALENLTESRVVELTRSGPEWR